MRHAEAFLVLLVILGGCAHPKPSTTVDVGHHRVRFVAPAEWEHLDQGRQQIFRQMDVSVVLEDLGPADRNGMKHDLERARETWIQGRRQDAFVRVRELRGPALANATSDAQAEFWKPWYDMTYGDPDSGAVARAFDAMIAGAERLPDVTPEQMAGYALQVADPRRGITSRPGREIARHGGRPVNGREWFEVETWSAVSHQDRSRLACLDNGGVFPRVRGQRRPPARMRLVAKKTAASLHALFSWVVPPY